MGSWYRVTLPVKEGGISGKARSLLDAFEAILMATRGPKDAAVFTNHDPGFLSHFYYFSPGAFQIARPLLERYSGVSCDAPTKGTVALLLGHADAPKTLLSASK